MSEHTQKAIEAEAKGLYPYPEYKNGGGYSDEDYREFYKTVCEHIDYKRKAFVAGRSKSLEEKEKEISDLSRQVISLETTNMFQEQQLKDSLLLYQNMVNTISEKDKEIRLLEERDVLWQNKHELLNDRIRELEEALREIAGGFGGTMAVSDKLSYYIKQKLKS